MKYKTSMALISIFALVICSGCNKNLKTDTITNITENTTTQLTDTTSSNASSSNYGRSVSSAHGSLVTSVVTMASTQSNNASQSKIALSSAPVGKPVTKNGSPANSSTTKGAAATTSTTNKVISITVSNNKPTTTTTTKAPTTASTVKSIWQYPYDLNGIYAESKKEIERLGMVWNESLKPDNCCWEAPNSTVVNTDYPDQYSLKNDVYSLIQCYYDMHKCKGCRIYFQPDPKYAGDYMFYFLYNL